MVNLCLLYFKYQYKNKKDPFKGVFFNMGRSGLSCSVAFNGSTCFANVLIAQPQKHFALSWICSTLTEFRTSCFATMYSICSLSGLVKFRPSANSLSSLTLELKFGASHLSTQKKIEVKKNLTSIFWRLGDSNSWPPACKAGALPAELNPHIRVCDLWPQYLLYMLIFFCKPLF